MTKEKHTSDGGSTGYYDLPSDAKDLQDLVEHKNMNFAIGNIFKACYRMGEKSGQDDLYDLNKIIFFAKREKKRIKKQNKLETMTPRIAFKTRYGIVANPFAQGTTAGLGALTPNV